MRRRSAFFTEREARKLSRPAMAVQSQRTAMAKSPNAVANLFNDKDTGLFSKLDTYVNGYTKSSGILDQRTDLLNKEKSRIADQQTRDTETIEKYQAQLTKTYANLDSLMAGFSSSLSSLSSVLSSLPSSSSKS